MARRLGAICAAILTVACSDGQAAGTSREASRATVVDSILPQGEALARFVRDLPETTTLGGGASSADELVSRFFKALSAGDAAAIRGMALSRAEYGHLYYPTSLYTKQPYELAPDIAWLLSSQGNAKGATRLIQRLGGRTMRSEGVQCMRTEPEGKNIIRSQCTISFIENRGEVQTRSLFQSMIERDGHVKFLSYSGDY